MTRDLPKTVPSAARAAADKAIQAFLDIDAKRQRAHALYHGDAYRRLLDRSRAQPMFADQIGKAQAIVTWGAMVQKELPFDRLDKRLRTPGGQSECLCVVRHEMLFESSPGFEGGLLSSELHLLLDAEEGLFRHYEWFNGMTMRGGGMLNTASGLHLSLHPQMLHRMHDLIADGKNWEQLEEAFEQLCQTYIANHKDR